jgi:DNA-binding LacI/PurR family transcriptional regulator
MPVTIKEVAKKAGVGIGTVSRVFNQSPLVSRETQNKVLDAARELGYYPMLLLAAWSKEGRILWRSSNAIR